MRFYVGLSEPSQARRLDRVFISANRLRRLADGYRFVVDEWVMDSGAFTEVSTHGGFRTTPAEYAALIRRFAHVGELHAAVAQDFMCEAPILARTGLTVAAHQRMTIERYDALEAEDTAGVYILPVLQGYEPRDYARHVAAYGDRLAEGSWVGVGSVCKRNGAPVEIARVLSAILDVRPDLRLHGFGIKLTSLSRECVVRQLFSADSMAWSFGARRNGRDQNDSWEARRYEQIVLRALERFGAAEVGEWAGVFRG